jgi:hypothetical protein
MEIPIYRKKIDSNTNQPSLDELGNEIMEFICYEIPYEPMHIEESQLPDEYFQKQIDSSEEKLSFKEL